MTSEISALGWVVKRWLPAMALAVVFGIATGVFRGYVAFVPGIQGMLALGILGYLVGRTGRGDADRFWTFGQRFWLALGAALVLGTVQVLVVSLVKAGPYDSPIEWLGNVVGGHLAESGAGVSRSAAHAYSLRLSGTAWVFFSCLDLLLGAFVFLATSIAGLSSPQSAAAPDEEAPTAVSCPVCGRPAVPGGGSCVGCGRELPAGQSAPAPRGSQVAAVLFAALVAGAGLLGGAAWLWQAQANRTEVLSLDNLHRNQKLVGAWELVAADRLEAIPAGQRRVAIKLLAMDEIVLLPEQEGAFLIQLQPVGRARTRFEGRLEPGPGFAWFALPSTLGGTLGPSVEAQASADDRSLRLVVERRTGDKRAFDLRRSD